MAATRTKCAHPFLANPRAPFRQGPLYAGETLPVACPCYLKADGLVYKCVQGTVGGVATLNAWDGFCIQGAATGEPVTLFGVGAEITCTTGSGDGTITPGAFYWIAASGVISNAIGTTATDVPFAKGVNSTTIRIIRPPL